MEKYDFSGYVTRYNVPCSDGRTIKHGAFEHLDGKTLPLVWNHNHDDPYRVVGNITLEHRADGMYGRGRFNESELGKLSKLYVEHGDITSMSIWANQLSQQGPYVMHGEIREVSLVLAGANPGAFIDNVIKHSADGQAYSDESEAHIYTSEEDACLELFHADEDKKEEKKEESKMDDNRTVMDVIETMNDEQKTVFYAMIGEAAGLNGKNNEGDDEMKHNVFEQEEVTTGGVLSHSDMQNILKDAKRVGSLKEAFLAHAESTGIEMSKDTYGDQTYGIQGADDWLFPEARLLNNPPEFIKRPDGWVSKVMNGVHHTPFSRIKSMFADITEDDARARGYIKGKLKKEEVFSLLKRTTTPTTIYKKQKMDRDDVIDITDFDVIAWIKAEMRMMLNEEIARAILIGDGRLNSSDDKINEMNIRPIWKDEDLFTIKVTVNAKSTSTDDEKAKAMIRAVVKSRKDYRGSGEPTMFTTEDYLTDMLLLEDNMGRVIYDSVDKLKSVLRVKEIVTVPVMEGLTDDNGDEVRAIIVNLKDYNVGADKGGAVAMFEDFDIDYNAQKYLIETRCSGALTKPFSAIVVKMHVGE